MIENFEVQSKTDSLTSKHDKLRSLGESNPLGFKIQTKGSNLDSNAKKEI